MKPVTLPVITSKALGTGGLDEACPLPPSLGHGNMFRVNAATTDNFLQCNPKKPTRGHVFALDPVSWRHLSQEEAEHRARLEEDERRRLARLKKEEDERRERRQHEVRILECRQHHVCFFCVIHYIQ
mgnify:CR=1 FL=1